MTSDTVVTGDMTITPIFNVITYTISYTLDGGVTLNPTKYTVEDEITINNPTRLGYTFSGWTGSNGDNLQTRVTIDKGTTGNLEFTANYSPNENTKYTVIHKYPTLNGTYEEETEILRGATDTTVTPALKNKTGFKGPEELQTVTISPDESTIVTYIYTREKYMLTIEDSEYVMEGNVSREYYYGEQVTLTAKERNHYIFTKWSNGDTNKEITLTIEEITTIKPMYKLSSYEVVFNSNNGTGTMDNQLINCDINTKLSKNTFTRDGYIFVEWNTKSNGTGISYSDEEEVINISTDETIELHAVWTEEEYVALVNGTYYTTLQAAVNAVPTNNTETKVKLLKNVSERITVSKNKNIVFDLGNFTISNPDNGNVFIIDGTVKINNGTITSDAGNGAINVNSSGYLNITGGKIIATGTRQAIYNAGRTDISENAYISALSTARGAVHNYSKTSVLNITGGTIISENYIAIKAEKGKLTIGTKDGNVDSTTPLIQGRTYAISSGVDFNFYDGILKSLQNGRSTPIQDETRIVDQEVSTDLTYDTEIINEETYKTEYLLKVVKHTITFEANGGEVNETTRLITDG